MLGRPRKAGQPAKAARIAAAVISPGGNNKNQGATFSIIVEDYTMISATESTMRVGW